MNASATFKAKPHDRRKTAALPCVHGSSWLPLRFRAARGSNSIAFNSQKTPVQLPGDHDFLQGIGRSLVENSAHLDTIDPEMTHPAAIVGFAWSGAARVERAKEWNATDDQSGANWNCVRAEGRGHGHPPRWAKETHCYAHI